MKVGLLLPSSNFIPTVGRDITASFKYGLGDAAIEVAVDTGGYNASKNLLIDKIQSLILKENVDLILAPLNIGLHPDLDPILKSSNVPLIALWMGEDPHYEQYRSDFVFCNGINQWQSAWMAGYHAAQLGKKVAEFCAVHDGGYGTSLAVTLGIEAGGADLVYTGISHRNSRTEDSSELIKASISDSPEVNVGLYSSKESISFLETYWSLGLSNDKLLGNHFMVEDDVLAAVGARAKGIRMVSNWDKDDTANPLNVDFATWFKKDRGLPVHGFGLLAYESGLLVGELFKVKEEGRNVEQLVQLLKDTSVEGPRGRVSFNQGEEVRLPEYLFEIDEKEDGTLYRKRIQELEVPEALYEQLALAVKNLEKNGWVNPYLIG